MVSPLRADQVFAVLLGTPATMPEFSAEVAIADTAQQVAEHWPPAARPVLFVISLAELQRAQAAWPRPGDPRVEQLPATAPVDRSLPLHGFEVVNGSIHRQLWFQSPHPEMAWAEIGRRLSPGDQVKGYWPIQEMAALLAHMEAMCQSGPRDRHLAFDFRKMSLEERLALELRQADPIHPDRALAQAQALLRQAAP